MSVLGKIVQHAKRLRNARRFGIPFFRRGSFAMPEHIKLGPKQVALVSPREHGAKIDAMVCFVEDDYGLSLMSHTPRTILDIGANLGFFSMAARGYFPEAEIHAYEPNPRILPFAQANAASAGFTLFAEAVGAEQGEVFMVDASDSNQASVAKSGEGTCVPQTSFQEAIKRLGGSVDLAKIDCEGAEWDLFECREQWSKIKSLRMEYHLLSRWSFADVSTKLDSLGFLITRHSPSGQWGTVWADLRV